ncbi:hypothetical protein F8S13_05210 [Chloroflexia bacterium SDU3-3]|nr:hypothetical protein F8S13_05210 [Chloroflexia bacterium SDU3-3]
MEPSKPSWELTILLFAISVTAVTGLAYRWMLLYSLSIPWFAWVLMVVACAALTIGPRFLKRRPKPE